VANLNADSIATEIFQVAFGTPELPESLKSWPMISSEDVADSVLYLLSTPTNVNATQLTIRPVRIRH
jgi:NADP-dependent 3-hydroxy acid dehydrogenase YdfG